MNILGRVLEMPNVVDGAELYFVDSRPTVTPTHRRGDSWCRRGRSSFLFLGTSSPIKSLFSALRLSIRFHLRQYIYRLRTVCLITQMCTEATLLSENLETCAGLHFGLGTLHVAIVVVFGFKVFSPSQILWKRAPREGVDALAHLERR